MDSYLTMTFLSTGITGAVYFSAYFFHYSLKFSQAKWYLEELTSMLPTDKFQNLPCKKPKEYPKIPWHRARGEVLRTT